MLKISDEFNEYISQVSLDFMKYTHNFVRLVIAEASRQKNIRLELIILMKLYKEMELIDREKEILDKHLLQYDYKTDLSRCVCQVVYEISDKTWMRIDNHKNEDGILMEKNVMAVYREYLKVLKQHTDSLLHAMCFNHEIILTNPVNDCEVRPIMNFDSDCLIQNNKLFVKKRKKTLN